MEIYENSAPADPGYFEATSNDELLSKIEVNNVTVEYNDTYDFCIEFDDGRHIVHQIPMTELSRKDIIEAQRVIIEHITLTNKNYIEDGGAWGSELL